LRQHGRAQIARLKATKIPRSEGRNRRSLRGICYQTETFSCAADVMQRGCSGCCNTHSPVRPSVSGVNYDAGHGALKYDKKMLNCSEWKAGFTPPSDFLDNELNPQHKLPTGVGSFHFQGDAKW
jgi:hypothetical protein